jgi:hypothetical protein
MSFTAFLILTAGLWLPADSGSSKDVQRKPSPWAPTLPALTQEEEQQLDEIINRFILFDTGKLTGDEGKKAKEDFDKLGPEATFALLRGLNRAARIESSCPALIIAKKLNKVLAFTDDRELLDFAKENIGNDVKENRHAATLQELKLTCQTRKAFLVRAKVPTPPPYGTVDVSTTPLTKLSLADLISTSTTAKPDKAKQAVLEIASRAGDDPLNALVSIASTVSDNAVKQSARDALDKSLSRLKADGVREKIKDKQAEMRAACARVAGDKSFKLGSELIDLLDDENAEVRDAAHQSLVRLAGGKTDYGPDPKADSSARTDAVAKWRKWWAAQK